MKKKSIITLCFVVVCAILLNYVAFIGFNIAGFSYGGMFGETGIKKGIDLAGGSVITFQADSDAPTDDQMQVVESIFQTRMRDIQKHVYLKAKAEKLLLKYLQYLKQTKLQAYLAIQQNLHLTMLTAT